MSLSIGLVAIQSVHFPRAFLRMDGSNVTQFQGEGSGTVNCQFYRDGDFPIPNIGNNEVFELIPLSGDDLIFGIRSLNYPTAFLRIDGSNVTQFQGGGSGTVNCQYYSSGTYPNEGQTFELLLLGRGVIIQNVQYYYIQSGSFLELGNVFVRMDGSKVTQSDPGGSGTVNCQFYAGGTPVSVQDYELFKFIPLTSYPGPW
jgi:hypothetical protein